MCFSHPIVEHESASAGKLISIAENRSGSQEDLQQTEDRRSTKSNDGKLRSIADNHGAGSQATPQQGSREPLTCMPMFIHWCMYGATEGLTTIAGMPLVSVVIISNSRVAIVRNFDVKVSSDPWMGRPHVIVVAMFATHTRPTVVKTAFPFVVTSSEWTSTIITCRCRMHGLHV